MTSFLVVFSHGEKGWYGTAHTAAKESDNESPVKAIFEVRKLALNYYENPRDFRAIRIQAK